MIIIFRNKLRQCKVSPSSGIKVCCEFVFEFDSWFCEIAISRWKQFPNMKFAQKHTRLFQQVTQLFIQSNKLYDWIHG